MTHVHASDKEMEQEATGIIKNLSLFNYGREYGWMEAKNKQIGGLT